MIAAHTVTAEATGVRRCCRERMFQPGLPNLLKPVVVIGGATHAIHVLRNHGVIVVWKCKPIGVLGPSIARICSYRQANLGSSMAILCHFGQVSHDDIGARLSANCWLP